MPRTSPAAKPEPRRVLTGAVLRAGALLEITQSSLADILGSPVDRVSQLTACHMEDESSGHSRAGRSPLAGSAGRPAALAAHS